MTELEVLEQETVDVQIIHYNLEHFRSCAAYADRIGLSEQFVCMFGRLKMIAKNLGGTLHVTKDFAPHSMVFSIERERVCLLNGGLIYQGPTQPANGSFPSLTVSLHNDTGWFIHT